MDKPRPKPLAPNTWTAGHLGKLKAAALKLGGAPDAEPTAEEGHAFAGRVPFDHAHVASATYNPDERRLEVKLHGGAIGFHVPVVGPAEPKEEKPEAKAPPSDGITRAVVVGSEA